MENKWLESAVDAYKKYFGDTANLIIDIGTRDGDDAEYFRQKLNGTEVYAFDANPLAIQETKKRYPHIVAIESAVSNYNGNTKFFQIVSKNADLAGCSSFIKIHETYGNDYSVQIDVPVITMEKFIDDVGLKFNNIDVVKIDVEGFSYEVLQGFSDYIHNVKLFHVETETFNRHHGHKDNEAVKRFMESKMFTLVDLSYEWGPLVEDQVWINKRFI